MEDLLKFLVTPLLSQPQHLKITSQNHALVIDTDPEDTGRVIGKHGSTIHAIRVLVKTYGLAHHQSPVTIILNAPPAPAKSD